MTFANRPPGMAPHYVTRRQLPLPLDSRGPALLPLSSPPSIRGWILFAMNHHQLVVVVSSRPPVIVRQSVDSNHLGDGPLIVSPSYAWPHRLGIIAPRLIRFESGRVVQSRDRSFAVNIMDVRQLA